MTTPLSEVEQEEAARTAWLLTLTGDQVVQYDRETIVDWLIARHDQRMERLRAACKALHDINAMNARAHARIRAALTKPAA
jgi:hypothetical protein